MAQFAIAIQLVLAHEGGLTNHELDRGGITKYGITSTTLSQYRGRSVSPEDIRDLQLDEAKEVYRKLFWDALNLDLIEHQKIADVIFDQAVNFGPSEAAKRAQRSCNHLWGMKVLEEDGRLGTISIQCINDINKNIFLREYIKQTQLAYTSIVIKNKDQSVFLRGWIARTHSLVDHVWPLDDSNIQPL